MINKILTFRVGEEKFCLDVNQIIGIDQKTIVSAVPLSVKHHIGMLNLRGQIIPVVDLRILFNVPTSGSTKEQCYIYIDTKQNKLACLVDSVYEVVQLEQNQNPISNIDNAKNNSNGYVDHIFSINKEIIFLLNSSKIYESINDFKINQAAS